jgi:hypothetical protein
MASLSELHPSIRRREFAIGPDTNECYFACIWLFSTPIRLVKHNAQSFTKLPTMATMTSSQRNVGYTLEISSRLLFSSGSDIEDLEATFWH